MRFGAPWLAFAFAKPCKCIFCKKILALGLSSKCQKAPLFQVKKFSKIFFDKEKYFSNLGKVLMRPSHTVLKSLPVKPWTGIFFSARRNVLMASNVSDGVMATQCSAQAT
jgi:hypothetical protein